MTREEFTKGYGRLTRGHRVEATAERAEATYHAIRHWSAVAWEDAVDVLLVEARMPDRTRLLAAVDAAAERQRRATKPEPYLPDRLPTGAPDYAYGQARLDIIKAMVRVRGKIDQRGVADRLFELADQFPAHADQLVADAAWHADRAQIHEAELMARAEAAGCRVREDSPSSYRPPSVTGNGPPSDFSGAPDPMDLPAPENASQGQIALLDPGPATGELSATPEPSADIVPGGAATREEPDDDANPF